MTYPIGLIFLTDKEVGVDGLTKFLDLLVSINV